MEIDWAQAHEISASVSSGGITATAAIEAALSRIASRDNTLNSFAAVLRERSLAKARALDAARAQSKPLGPLAGVPFAVKNLFDIAGLATVAGSKINRDHAPATADATLIARLESAGAILVGALNMGEYAYDFTGENVHYGACRNPHDLARMSGGSSSGSGASIAGGLVPLALGSDTNGSIRVPASFCGIFGLKPTYGRLSRGGTFPFVTSLDHVGPFARSVHDLALAYDAMQGPDPRDPVCVDRPVKKTVPLLDRGTDGLRIAVAGGYFQKGAYPEAQTALRRVAQALDANAEIDIPHAQAVRAAAYVITASEAGALHLDRLRERAADFDPAVRDRLIAGAMIPAPLVVKAQKFRRWYREQMLALFSNVDAIIAPATPCAAPRIGQETFVFDGAELPLRPNIGVYTQPISFIGLPVVAAPVPLTPLPIGVQIIAAPWCEDVAMRVAYALEQMGVAGARRPEPANQPDKERGLGNQSTGRSCRSARSIRALRAGARKQ
jgi:1-carboxybiuret hydrolase